MDGADVCGTSSRASRRPPDVISAVAILDPRWRTPEMTSSRTWGGFFDPYCGGGARWRPSRFRSPSWMTSFAESEMRSSKMATGSGRAAILRRRRNGGRKTALYYCRQGPSHLWSHPVGPSWTKCAVYHPSCWDPSGNHEARDHNSR